MSSPSKTIDTPYVTTVPPSDPLQPPPLPPPLPPMRHRPSHFLAQLQSAPKDYLSAIPKIQHQAPAYEPIYYFFYGTLTQPETLKRILDLKEEPVLRQAQIVGYSLAKWGDYLTLLDGPPGNVVSGHAYMVRSSDDEWKLAYYETLAYKPAPCQITFTGNAQPARVSGRTFMYAGDAAALREKRFDRTLWMRQMSHRPTSNSIEEMKSTWPCDL
jgi:hypothetical protein